MQVRPLATLVILAIPQRDIFPTVRFVTDPHLLRRSSRVHGFSSSRRWYVIPVASFERQGWELTHAIIRTGEKGKRHCLPNASIMIHRELLSLSPLCPRLNVVVSSQNHPEVHPVRLLILPFTQRKFYVSVSSSRESTNGIAVCPGSRRYRVCTASVRASVFEWMACLT
jgi:hypothetical protein